MKLFCLLLLLFPVSMLGQHATIVFVSDIQSTPVTVIRPVDGISFWAARIRMPLDANHQFMIPNDVATPGIMQFETYRDVVKLYVRPGQSYRITYMRGRPLAIAAEDAEGQMALQSIYRNTVAGKADILQRTGRGWTYIVRKLEREQEEQIDIFKKLLKKGKIDAGFYDCVDRLAVVFRAAVMSLIVSRESRALTTDIRNGKYNEVAVFRMENQWKDMLYQCNVNFPKNRVSPYYRTYCANVLHYYYEDFFQYKEGLNPDVDTSGVALLKRRLVNIEKYFAEPSMKEYMLAWEISQSTATDQAPVILSAWDYFEKTYPRSALKPYVANAVKALRHPETNINVAEKAPASKRYSFLDGITQLEKQFNDTAAYIVVWNLDDATCHQALAYIDESRTLLKEKGVELAYLNVNGHGVPGNLEKMIGFFKLDGQHFDATYNLMSEFSKQYTPEKSGTGFIKLPVPQYIVIDHGRITSWIAAPLSDVEGVKRQLATLETK